MPPKRAKSQSGSTKPAGDQGLAGALFCEEGNWNASLAFVVGNRIEDSTHIETLVAAVKGGTRKLFSSVSREDLFNQVLDLGNTKTPRKGKEVPQFYEICEPCKQHLDNGEQIPLPLLARLIKFKLLDIKSQDVRRREAEKRALEDRGKSSKGKADKKETSRSPTKGGKSAAGRGKTPEPPFTKADSKLKKRGEEDLEAKYINDEPDDGPQHYIIITGFHHPHLLLQLSEIGINIDAIININSQSYDSSASAASEDAKNAVQEDAAAAASGVAEDEEKKIKERAQMSADELRKFWRDVLLLMQKAPDNSSLHDVARLEYSVPDCIVPSNAEDNDAKVTFAATLFEVVACMMYNLLDAKRQWKNYLTNLQLFHIPPALGTMEPPDASEVMTKSPMLSHSQSKMESVLDVESAKHGPGSVEVDMRRYNDLISSVPLESVSVPLIMHCMLQQVCAYENPAHPDGVQTEKSECLEDSLSQHLSTLAFKLALTIEERKKLLPDYFPPVSVVAEGNQKQPILISFHDDLTRRLNHLQPVDGFNPVEAELKMLGYSPASSILARFPSAPDQRTALEHAARFQELLFFCTQQEAVSKSDINRALQQFVLECMNLTTVDERGRICRPRMEQKDIPWDDPYPYYVGMIPTADKRVKSGGVERPDSSCKDFESDKVDENDPEGLTRSGSILRRPDSRGSRKRASSCHSVHFEEDESGQQVPHPGDEDLDETKDCSQSSSSNPSQNLSSGHTSSLGDLSNVFNDCTKRNLDEWQYAEHMEPKVLLQALLRALETQPYIDTYYQKRDNSFLIVLHNPRNPSVAHSFDDWHVALHSNVRFRNYLEYVAGGIVEWTQVEEAKYEARLLAAEVAKLQKEDEEPPATPTDGRSRSKSPKKADSRAGKSPLNTTDRSTPCQSFVRAGSLKAWKEEQARIKAEEEEQERLAEEKRAKSAQKKNMKETLAEEKKSKEKEKETKKQTDSKSVISEAVEQSNAAAVSSQPERYWPFTGYDVGDKLVHIAGINSTLFPDDGGHIITERIQYLHGSTSVKATVRKSGHSFTVHVIDPKLMNDNDGQNEAAKEDAGECVDESAAAADEENVSDIRLLNCDMEKKITEDNDNRKKDCSNEPGEAAGTEEGCELSPAGDSPPEKPGVGRFGSFTAQFSDGMVLSVSTFGPSGEPPNGKPYEPEPYTPPVQSITVTGGATERDASPAKRAKASDKTSKDKEKDKDKSIATDAMTAEGEVKEEVMKEVHVFQPFQQMYITCPDGLNVTYFLESSLGIALGTEERKLLVRQSYPVKTKCLQKCEAARKTAMREQSRVVTSEGTVIKTMTDGTTQVLSADGTVSEFCFSSSLLPASLTVVPDIQQVVKEVVSSASKKKSGRRNLRSDQTGAVTPAEEETQVKGYWITTLPTGERIANRLNGSPVEVPNAVLCVASDPQTLQVMHTREDHVITIHHPDGLVIVEHSDGTRITTKYQQIEESPQEDSSKQGKEQQLQRTDSNAQQEHEDQERTEVGEHEEETDEEQEEEDEEEMNEFDFNAALEEIREVNETQPSTTKVAKFVLVECPGYASVKFDSESGLCSTEFGSGCVVDCMTAGRYDVFHQAGGFLHLDPDGTAVYYDQPDGRQTQIIDHHPQYYVMRHFDGVIAETIDKRGTHYIVTNLGENHVNLLSDFEEPPKGDDASFEGMNGGRRSSAEICSSLGRSPLLRDAKNTHGNHVPRLFVVQCDGSGQELLRSDDVAPYLSSAEHDPSSVVLKAPLPDCTDVYGITVLRPLPKNTSQTWLKGYLIDSIIPVGLKSRDLRKTSPGEAEMLNSRLRESSKLGANSTAAKAEVAPVAKRVLCPSHLEFRQLIKYNSVSEVLRTKMSSALKAFADHVKQRLAYNKEVSIQDTRTDEERATAEELQARLLTPCATPQELKSVDDLKSIYEKALTPVERSVVTESAKMRMKRYDLGKVKQELAEEQECRLALRLRNISPYFKSDLASDFCNKQENKQTLSKQFLGYISCGTPEHQSEDAEPSNESILQPPPGIACHHESPAPADTAEVVEVFEATGRDNETPVDNNLSNRVIGDDTRDSAEEKPAEEASAFYEEMVMARVLDTTESNVIDQPIVFESSFANENMSPKPVDDQSKESCVVEPLMTVPEVVQKPADDEALPAFKMPDFKGVLADLMSGKNAEDIEKSITGHEKTPNQKTGKDLNNDSASIRPITNCDEGEKDFLKDPCSAANAVDECGAVLQRPMTLNRPASNCDEDDPMVTALTTQNAWQPNGNAKQPDCDHMNGTLEQDIYSAQRATTKMDKSQSDNKWLSQMSQGEVGSLVKNMGVESPHSNHSPVPGCLPYGKRPGANQNIKDSVRRRVNDGFVAGATSVGYQMMSRTRGMELTSDRVDFGVLKEGNTYAVNLSLRNTGVDACRFRVKQPPPSTGVKILYKPGPVAAGMKADIQVEIYAIAAGVEGDRGVGLIAHNVQFTTETDQMLLPVTATVLTANEFDCRSPDSPRGGKSPGVKLVSNKPPAGVGLIRPRKHLMHGASAIVN